MKPPYTDAEIAQQVSVMTKLAEFDANKPSCEVAAKIIQRQHSALKAAEVYTRMIRGMGRASASNAKYLREMIELAVHALEDEEADPADARDEARATLREALEALDQ